MTGWHILPAAARIARPWKNGGGVTREVAVHPAGSNYEAFDWRLSLAQVHADGPFSLFAGVDRWLAVTHGTLQLDLATTPSIRLAACDPPLAFAGDVPVHGRIGGGPVQDCNLMVRRDFGTGRMQWVSGPVAPRPGAGAVALLVAPHGGRLRHRTGAIDLAPGDAIAGEWAGDAGWYADRAMLIVEILPS